MTAAVINPAPVADTPEALQAVGAIFDRHVIFPSPEARDAVVLWVLHTHAMPAWSSTPRLAVTSPDPGSGKSRVLELIQEMVPHALTAVSLTPAVMWRTLAKGNATIMIDEADTIFGTSGSSSSHRQLRAIINAGHRRGATVPRAVGAADVMEFPVYGACALAALGALPETIAVRSVRIRMRPPTEDEHVEPYRESDAAPHLAQVKKELETWGRLCVDDLARARPDMPVRDREADVWEPLVAIADHAGGEWPYRARDACQRLTAKAVDQSIGTLLLAGIRALTFERIFTDDLLAALYVGPDGWNPRNLNPGSLARHLSPYGVAPGTIRIGRKTAKGYYRRGFVEAWERNLPVTASQVGCDGVTA